MTSLDKQNEVIRLRGLGYSFDSIVTTLKVSKPTLIKICKKHTAEINKIQTEQISATLRDAVDSIEVRSKLYRDLIKRLYEELANRDLTSVSTDRLMAMLEKAERSLAAIEIRQKINGLTDFDDLSDEDLAKIAVVGEKALLELV